MRIWWKDCDCRIFNAKRLYCLSGSKKMGFPGPPEFTSHGYFKRRVYKIRTILGIFKEMMKNALQTQHDSAVSNLRNQRKGATPASWFAAGPFWKFFAYSSLSLQFTQPRRRGRGKILLMFSYLCVTEFLRLKFHVYGNAIKRIKRWRCVFCYVFF